MEPADLVIAIVEQQQLLTYLRANGYKTFIVSGGGVEFMRPWTEAVYGIPPEQVVCSTIVTKYETPTPDKPVLTKETKVEFVDDGPGKPAGINRFIGGGRCSLSAIRTAISRCWNGRRPARGRASRGWCRVRSRPTAFPSKPLRRASGACGGRL